MYRGGKSNGALEGGMRVPGIIKVGNLVRFNSYCIIECNVFHSGHGILNLDL